jgi:phage baseplate assembly protein W
MSEPDFLGAGWSFRQLTENNCVGVSAGDENIRESIWTILATSKGERVMRPTFGCGMHDLVFALNDAATVGQVKQEVFDALVAWEPRIDVLDVDVEVKGQGEVLLINIHYRVRTTNNHFNLVYPFYLEVGTQ